MWDGWNPVQDIKDEWEATKSTWGKLKVFLFYSYVWLVILFSIISFFAPRMFGWDCLLGGDDGIIVLRFFILYAVSFFLFIARDGTKITNMRFLVGFLLIAYVTFLLHRNSIEDYCFETMFPLCTSDVIWVLAAIFCAYAERHVDEGTSGETTPLVV